MRPIGQLDREEQAKTLADYRFVRDIETQVEPTCSGAWAIWVVDEGQALLSRFRCMPDAEEFSQASEAAARRPIP